MKVKELFSGIAVIIDNDINEVGSSINKIKQCLIDNHMPVVCYDELPSEKSIPAFSNASFVIIDWDLQNDSAMVGIDIGDALEKDSQKELMKFIKLILDSLFVPVFIFSGLPIENIENSLIEANLYNRIQPNRIFLKSKDEVDTEEELFANIESWLKKMPSAYVLKVLEKGIRQTQNKMFVDWYQYSPEWVKVIWKILKKDSNSEDVKREFGDFLLSNLMNRVGGLDFEVGMLQMAGHPSKSVLHKVLEYERFIRYEKQPRQAYTGDLFLIDEEYYLNIRAQCDLSRRNDVELYLLQGNQFSSEDIEVRDIRVTNEGEIRLPGQIITLEELKRVCDDVMQDDSDAIHRLNSINNRFVEYKNKVFFHYGEILEKRTEAFLACIDNEKIIKFDLKKFSIKTLEEVKKYRIGRVLPPYITRIQQKFSQYMVREGIMPLPKELFEDL